MDLLGSTAITSIVLHNRTSSDSDRARTIQVLISQDGITWTTIFRNDGSVFRDITVDGGGRSARCVRVQLAETNYLHLMEVEMFGSTGGTPQPNPPTTMVKNFDNYNSSVACTYGDRATFSLKEPIRQAEAALWYDFGSAMASASYTLVSGGRTIRRGSMRKGDCAAGYTWCHGFIDLGDLDAGTYTVITTPAQVCHNTGYDGGNGFVMVSGIPRN